MSDYFEQQTARRAKAYPTEQRAMEYMQDAYSRLTALGWHDPRFYPPSGGHNGFVCFILRGCFQQVHCRSWSDGVVPDDVRSGMFLWRPATPEDFVPRGLFSRHKSALSDFLYAQVAMRD